MSLGRVQEKVALVTGAGSGIGRATAALLASEGATVFAADLNEQAVQAVTAEIMSRRGKATPLRLDVADEATWQQATEHIRAAHQRLDIVVNNAGVSFAKPVTDTSLDEWRQVLSVNLDGVFLGTKYGIRAMQPGGGGSIVNVASVSGIKPFAGASAYGASKAAVRLFSKIAAIECQDAKNGVRVNVVTPGGVKTPMWQTVDFFRGLVAEHGGTEEAFAAMAGAVPSQQFFAANEVAQTILYLASDESAHLTGVELVMDRGHTG
ncbi:MAG TPA: SDR family NAD(P)-dependent oxidoreductase [Gemmataceae bacterium]|nr:SDR family NAD(P)-dependent oxidoreductase [Gemmataceae bacterium]